jgi:pimeloyl-ACP methyl ester carboxylesterase
MARFLLVAGAWHGAWSWEFVIPLLAARGHRAEAVELPGMGADRTPLAGLDMMAWANTVARAIESDPEPALLVGHSRGGAVISQTAELVPDRIRANIYVTALLLLNGEAPLDVTALITEGAPAQGEFVPTPDGLAFRASPEAMAMAYRHAPSRRLERAMARITPEPRFALLSPLSLSAARYGKVPRAYIECVDDELIPLSLQRAMQARQPCAIVRTLPGDHCPNYSAPERLAEALDDIAKTD